MSDPLDEPSSRPTRGAWTQRLRDTFFVVQSWLSVWIQRAPVLWASATATMRRQLDLQSSREFLAALPQISAAALSILVAGVTAYLVFVGERLASFDEEIYSIRVDLQDALIDWKIEWRGAPMLPVEFSAEFKSRYPTGSL